MKGAQGWFKKRDKGQRGWYIGRGDAAAADRQARDRRKRGWDWTGIGEFILSDMMSQLILADLVGLIKRLNFK
ncbi:hypothetical protein GUJ93_ZPchr0004g38517 [Zizania palustris]|uniref:Uncharacterized protein n=1 Tax=Zizania palustris TaxID=103762 RepID=A0A8J5VFY7_ZIZPA|nr:hypothetical protein GUJ93_ZPchr0004g38517 [Zizania palustris]